MGAKKGEVPKISNKMMEVASVIAEGRNNIIQQGLEVSGLEKKGKSIFLKGITVPVSLKIRRLKIGNDLLEIYQFFMEKDEKASFTFGSLIEFKIKENGATIIGLKYEELLALDKEKKLGLKL